MAAITEEIKIPEGIEVKLIGKTVEVSGQKGKLVRTFDVRGIELRQGADVIVVEAAPLHREQRAAIGMVRSHLNNMFKGVKEGFVYKLRVVYAHFPITVKVEGKRVLVQNFLGERSPRAAEVVGGSSVRVEGDEIIVEGVNKEEVGQTAVNIEQATSVKYRDRRTFQDGIYIISRE